MSINPSKYIKLSTEPWTGNGISQPIKSITLQDIPTNPSTGKVELTELNNELLVNGQAISPGPSAVLSLTSAPGSVVSVTPETGIGAVTLGTFIGSGVTSITAAPPLQVTPVAPNQTNAILSIDSTSYIKSITSSSFNLSLSPTVGDIILSSFGNIGSTVLSQTFFIPGTTKSDMYINTSALPPGVYLLEATLTLAFNQLFETETYFKVSGGSGAGGRVSCYANTIVSTTPIRMTLIQSLSPFYFPQYPNWLNVSVLQLYNANDTMTVAIYRVS